MSFEINLENIFKDNQGFNLLDFFAFFWGVITSVSGAVGVVFAIKIVFSTHLEEKLSPCCKEGYKFCWNFSQAALVGNGGV